MNTEYSGIAQAIQQAAETASSTSYRPEAKLRELVEPLWDEYIKAKRINLHFQPRNERTLANGRADTVYNRLILEYKKPGAIKPDNDKNRQLIAQVKGYIEDLAKEERWKEERLLGVVFDGKYFLYIRKVGRWVEDEPLPVDADSVERFLLTLEKLTTKKALVPENVIRDFAVGAEARNYIASNAIRAFYFALAGNVNERVKAFFDQWALQFAEAHGTIENKRFDAETLFQSYGFKKQEQRDFSFLAFFFALDTYFALLMKLLAYQVVGFYTLKNLAGLPLTEWETLDADSLKDKLQNLEDGGIFRSEPLNIRNFLEGDLLSWYLNDWNSAIEQSTRAIIERLNQYDPETMELVPDETRDILKKLYQFLVPRQIRHDLGEYYTPDWLAERCLNQVGYGVKEKDLQEKRLLDPGCGSGTFLILAIKRAREHARLNGIDPTKTLAALTRNTVGFDINPLAVIAARTNYLLAIADLLKYKQGDLTVPVYLCDSINPPRIKEQAQLFDQEAGYYTVPTIVEQFRFPHTLIKRDLIQKTATLLEESVKKRQSEAKFLERLHSTLKLPESDSKVVDKYIGETYTRLLKLEEKGINGIWARIIKNAFAPLFVGQFDFIVGNPPWVNWESLPQQYREATSPIWQRYDLFEHTGLRARLGSAKDDISVLMTYVSLDNYLKDNGKLCFVITQTLFKTVGGGEGFRRFRLGKRGQHIKVLQVDDMVDLQPFEAATNRTAVFLCQKGEETKYPVEYHLWRKKEKGSIANDLSWGEVQAKTVVRYLKAQSIDGSEQGSWISARPKAIKSLSSILGPSDYTARAGTCGWLNSAFWVRIVERKGKSIVIENYDDNAKKEVRAVRLPVEPELVYPLLRGRDVGRWESKSEIYIIYPQDKLQPSKAITAEVLKQKCPLTYSYFEQFQTELQSRNGYKKYLNGEPFYALYNSGPYTLSPFKVAWKYIAVDLTCCVLSEVNNELVGKKLVIPDHRLMIVSLNDLHEAHYLCAVLNSTLARFIVHAYGISTQLAPHILKNIRIPKYDPKNETHRELANLSKQCHEKVAEGISVSELEEHIDELAAELWGLKKAELKDIKDSLEEMQ